MNHEKLKEVLHSKKWKFAKTMPTMPHSYTLEKNWEDKKLFNECWDYINKHGEERIYGRRIYWYYRIDNHDYWSLHVTECKIINRCEV
jgi:hypothetical protein